MDFMNWQGTLQQQLQDSPRPILCTIAAAVYDPQKTQIFSELFTCCSLIHLLFDSIACMAMAFQILCPMRVNDNRVRVFGI